MEIRLGYHAVNLALHLIGDPAAVGRAGPVPIAIGQADRHGDLRGASVSS